MKVFTWDGFGPVPASYQQGVITIGNFDGVHRGHAALLRRLVRLKKRLGCPAIVVTFAPSPTSILRPHLTIEALSTVEDRIKRISEFPVDSVLLMKTTTKLLDLDATTFWKQLLRGNLKIRGIVEGLNFCFGKDRLGTIQQLQAWCSHAELPLELVDDVYRRGMRVSSSAIRAALHQGDVKLARHGLGRCYGMRGVVVHGDHRGRSIGFPTINLSGISTLVPLEGVYAATAWIDNERRMAAVNIGPNPTFNIEHRKVEAHLLDFDGDLYGKPVTLDLIDRLRDTRRFDSVHELQKQLQQDTMRAREIVTAYWETRLHVQR